MTSTASYSRAAVLLHWLIAAALAFQLGLGLRAEQLAQGDQLFDVLQLHKSVGITILLLTLMRVTIRFFKPPPPALTDKKWALFLSKLTHFLLYAFMIGAPLTGWLLASTSKLEIDTILFGTIPWPHFPGTDMLAMDTKSAVHEASESAHKYLSWLGLTLFLLHVAGALRHQFLKSEPLLARMLPIVAAHKRIAGSFLIAGIAALLTLIMVVTRGPDAEADALVETTASRVVPEQPTQPVAAQEEDALLDTETLETTEPSDQPEETENNAQPETVETPEPEPATVSDWTVVAKDPIRFSVDRSGSAVQGSFSSWNADIKFSPDALDRSAVRISVNLSSALTGDSSVDQALQGADFFSTSRFSTAEVSLNQFRALGGNRYEGTGTMKLKNITKPVKTTFNLDINGATATASGTASVSRSAHQVGVGDYSDIADNVSVSFSLSARRN